MTDNIDLDELAVEDDEEEQPGNYGDWLWRNEGSDAGVEPPGPADDGDADATGESGPTADSPNAPAPGVPATSEDPVGVPGNAGTGVGDETDSGGENGGEASGNIEQGGTAETHGATDPDDMTMAMTYKAAHYVTDPGVVFADAGGWADWLGIVGEVSTPVIRKFQRDNRIELDFFGGSESGPDARLEEIDRESMFFAERMVLVGTEADEWIADEAGWEFVPIETAAEKADWELRDDL